MAKFAEGDRDNMVVTIMIIKSEQNTGENTPLSVLLSRKLSRKFSRKSPKLPRETSNVAFADFDLSSLMKIHPPKDGKFSAEFPLQKFKQHRQVLLKSYGARIEVFLSEADECTLNGEQRIKNTESMDSDCMTLVPVVPNHVGKSRRSKIEKLLAAIGKNKIRSINGEVEPYRSAIACTADRKLSNTPELVTKMLQYGHIILPIYIEPNTIEYFIDGAGTLHVRAIIKGALRHLGLQNGIQKKQHSTKRSNFLSRMWLMLNPSPGKLENEQYKMQHPEDSKSQMPQFLSEKLSHHACSAVKIPLSLPREKSSNTKALLRSVSICPGTTTTCNGIFQSQASPKDSSYDRKSVKRNGSGSKKQRKNATCTWILERQLSSQSETSNI